MRALTVDGRLEAMAGPAAFSYTASGVYDTDPDPSPSVGWSVYSVLDVVSTGGGAWWPHLTAGVLNQGQARIICTASSAAAAWSQAGTGVTLGSVSLPVPSTGRHVWHQVTLPGDSSGIAGYDGHESSVTFSGSGSGFLLMYFATAAPANQAGVRSLVFNRAHNRSERARVLDWLARRYSLSLSLSLS